MNKKKIQKEIERALAKASFVLRDDVLKALKSAYKKEKSKRAKTALGWIIENANIAKKEKLAICQDTGLPIVFIEAGRGIDKALISSVERGVVAGYKNNYLRPSMADPLKRSKTGYEGGATHIEFSSKIKGLKITILSKGFGCENKSQLKMFNPTVSLSRIEDFIVKAVKEAGPEACPPFVVGVGIGGTSDSVLLLAKKALLGRIDKPLSGLERRLLKKINSLRIGPMGLGGKTTALAVKIKKAPTHIAGLPVGVNISCHALRSATILIK